MLASSSKHVLRMPARALLSAETSNSVGDLKPVRSASLRAALSRRASTQVQLRYRSANHDQNRPPDTIRSKPWSFGQGNTFQFNQGSLTMRYNMKMQDRLAVGDSAGAIELAAEMKEKGIDPDLTTYNFVIQAFADKRLHQEAWAALGDLLALGLQPDVTTFNSLLQAFIWTTSTELQNVLHAMSKLGVPPNAKTYDVLIDYYIEGGNLEVALCKLAEMNDLGFSPSLQAAQAIIRASGERGLPKLALDLAEGYEATSVRRLDNETWVKLLVSSAESLYADGVKQCWEKVVDQLGILPDEGLCQAVLHTAARHGMPSIAASAIKKLEELKIKFREYHLAPLLDAFVRNGQIKEAMRVLDLMRDNGIAPTLNSAQSLLLTIQRDPDTIDSAYAILEDLHKEGLPVDTVAANVVIEASRFINDLQRAVGTYKAMSSLSITPDITTFNILLSACLQSSHFELGNRLYGEMREAGLKPNSETYATFIALILTEADYENAFFYLEEMKAQGFQPPYKVYEDIVRKCVSVGDTRFKLAVEELEQMGYQISSGLQSFIDSGGKEWKDEPQELQKTDSRSGNSRGRNQS